MPKRCVSHALTVNTGGAKEVANRKHGAHSPASGFAIVHVDERRAVRIVGAIHMSLTGTVTQDEDVIPAKVEVMPGKHWLKITPRRAARHRRIRTGGDSLRVGDQPVSLGLPRGSAAGRQRGFAGADLQVACRPARGPRHSQGLSTLRAKLRYDLRGRTREDIPQSRFWLPGGIPYGK